MRFISAFACSANDHLRIRRRTLARYPMAHTNSFNISCSMQNSTAFDNGTLPGVGLFRGQWLDRQTHWEGTEFHTRHCAKASDGGTDVDLRKGMYTQ